MFSIENIRYINGSTSLPVDMPIRQNLEKAITPELMDALDQSVTRHKGGFDGIDIIFVSAKNLDHDRSYFEENTEEDYSFPPFKDRNYTAKNDLSGKINLEFLGIYCTEHPYFGRQIIQINPERVFSAVVQLQDKTQNHISLEDLYPTLLSAMVMYGLACWLMDENDMQNGLQSGSIFTNQYEKDPISGRESLSKIIEERLPRCYGKWEMMPQWYYADNPCAARMVEKSLATAIMLSQNWHHDIKYALEAFVQNSSPEYAVGLNWQLSHSEVLSTARSWKKYKWNFLEKEENFFSPIPKDKMPTTTISERLNSGIALTSEVDFCRHYIQLAQEALAGHPDMENIENFLS